MRIVEVGPRDGLQSADILLSANDRISMCEQLVSAGLSELEVGSFVSKKWVPAMANTADVVKAVPGWVLVPNEQGAIDAGKAGAKQWAVFTTVSETFSQKNTNCSIEQMMMQIQQIMQLAEQCDASVRAYISCVVNCPYEGAMSATSVAKMAESLFEQGVTEVSLGDTTGQAHPHDIVALLNEVRSVADISLFAGHYHDTYGMGVANVLASVESGLVAFDSSIAGLGGCPYAPGASGNVATEDVLYLLQGYGLLKNIDLQKVCQASRKICQEFGLTNRARVTQALGE